MQKISTLGSWLTFFLTVEEQLLVNMKVVMRGKCRGGIKRRILNSELCLPNADMVFAAMPQVFLEVCAGMVAYSACANPTRHVLIVMPGQVWIWVDLLNLKCSSGSDMEHHDGIKK
ncbi:hypothetical protein U9M48_022036 [Paspalum notatum var. saurae]|uniref:Uncharacterized protein n=1 Tax=Paspalum notatum var. saurae TaxID=547442 RepID=A0AAQ3TIR0_PASNO